MPIVTLLRLALLCGAGAVPAAAAVGDGGVWRTVAGAAAFAVCQLLALWLARPLARGEVERMGGSGAVVRLLRLLEAP